MHEMAELGPRDDRNMVSRYVAPITVLDNTQCLCHGFVNICHIVTADL